MSTYSATIAPHQFAYGYYRQSWWAWLIGSAFFFGEIGAGLFLVSLLTEQWLGMAIGYFVVVVGKNLAHLLYLGRPERFWRAAMRPDRSWIARGLWATGIFALTGFVILAPYLFNVSWQLSGWASTTIYWLAGLSALFIMFYDGFVMSFSTAIPFWHTKMLPLLCLTYATLGGVTLWLTLVELSGTISTYTGLMMMMMMRIEYALLITNFVLLAIYLFRMSRWHPAARETVRSLLRGPYARVFLGLVVLLGLVGTLLLASLHVWFGWTWLVIGIAATELTGDFALLMVLLKSGLLSAQAVPSS
jgi:formate-dependent nitrite reductase membrane component NrfD